jgi:hypothetical protein
MEIKFEQARNRYFDAHIASEQLWDGQVMPELKKLALSSLVEAHRKFLMKCSEDFIERLNDEFSDIHAQNKELPGKNEFRFDYIQAGFNKNYIIDRANNPHDLTSN